MERYCSKEKPEKTLCASCKQMELLIIFDFAIPIRIPHGRNRSVINKAFHLKTFVYLTISVTSSDLLQARLMFTNELFFFTSKVDIMNTPHQWSDSFFTLLATKPPVRTAVDVTPIIDLARRSRSSQLAEFLMFLPPLHAAEMPHPLPAGLRNHLLRWNQHIIAYLHLSC